jgi:lysyl-tRNA synthetase class I
MDGLAIHNAIYDFAKANGIEGKTMFTDIYQSLIGKQKGPRAGKLIAALGIERLKKDLGL